MGTGRSTHRIRSRVRVSLVASASCALLLLALGAPGAQAQSPIAPAPAGSPGGLFIDADTVLGSVNLTDEEKPLLTCVQNSRYARNEEIVWRVKVFDPLTGQPLDDSQLASVQIILPDQTLDMHFGGHPKSTPVDTFWAGSWAIPADYPTGVLPYTIQATGLDGRVGTYQQFGVALAQLTITEEVHPIASPAA